MSDTTDTEPESDWLADGSYRSGEEEQPDTPRKPRRRPDYQLNNPPCSACE